MALNIRNDAVNQLAKKLAALKHMNKTDAGKLALENELRRIEETVPLRERLRPLQDGLLAHPARIEQVPITARETATALAAFSRYGKGREHPAQLNLGDCFAYAMAKNHQTSILFKGEDFSHTDIRSAAARHR